jgi:hypothetical protein
MVPDTFSPFRPRMIRRMSALAAQAESTSTFFTLTEQREGCTCSPRLGMAQAAVCSMLRFRRISMKRNICARRTNQHCIKKIAGQWRTLFSAKSGQLKKRILMERVAA